MTTKTLEWRQVKETYDSAMPTHTTGGWLVSVSAGAGTVGVPLAFVPDPLHELWNVDELGGA